MRCLSTLVLTAYGRLCMRTVHSATMPAGWSQWTRHRNPEHYMPQFDTTFLCAEHHQAVYLDYKMATKVKLPYSTILADAGVSDRRKSKCM